MTPSSGRPSPPRLILYLFCVVLFCPIRYWGLGADVDSTWRFALNFAAAQGLLAGRDIIFTYGPLGYLLFPEQTGHNLTYGLIFQGLLWIALAAILADLFFRANVRVRNLAVFTLGLALASPLFWFNYAGGENLILAGSLLLIVVFQMRGGTLRYVAALTLIGLLPLFKITAGMIGVAALAGFSAARLVDHGRKALPLALATLAIPPAISAIVCLICLRDLTTCLSYLRGSAQLASGFSAAMSLAGSNLEVVAAAIALGLLLILLRMQAATSPALARFYALMLAIPLFVSFKHGFVRQDIHVINYFCFVALAAALIALTAAFTRRHLPYLAVLILIPLTIRQDEVPSASVVPVVAEMLGLRSIHELVGAIPPSWLRERLAASIDSYPADQRLEPAIIAAIGAAPVASLSIVYTELAAAGLRLQLYPVFQRYAAFTAELDARNAEWVRERGPRYLIFDGAAIDNRDAWAETPAMWLDVYRWYDTRLLAPGHLLLERRAGPRFGALQSSGRRPLAWPGDLALSNSPEARFWSATCMPTLVGRAAQALFRIPEVNMTVFQSGTEPREVRVIPAVLSAPVLENLPVTLEEFAAVFRGESLPPVQRLRFDGPGARYYTCQAELLTAAMQRP